MGKTEAVRNSRIHTRYRIADGTLVPGVTTALNTLAKPALIPWAWRLGVAGIEMNAYRDGLAVIGTLAHSLILATLGGMPPDFDDYTINEVKAASVALEKFTAWMAGHKVEVVAVEQQVISEAHRFGGTLDLLARVNGRVTVLDLKTSGTIYVEHLAQVSGYALAAIESGTDVEAVAVLSLPRDPSEPTSDHFLVGDERLPYQRLFLAALETYNAQKNIKAQGGKA